MKTTKKKLFNDLPQVEQDSFHKHNYDKVSYVQKTFSKDHINLPVVDYAEKFRDYFTKTLKKRLNIDFDKLENLHKSVNPELTNYDFSYGINKLTEALYDMDEEFTHLYHSFVKDWVKKNVAKGRPFLFQKTPTIRVHCPGSNSESVFPAYHNDMFLGHNPCEINIWFPLTPKGKEGHGFTVCGVEESKKLLSKYNFNIPNYYSDVRDHKSDIYRETHAASKPVDTEFGEVLVFDLRSIHSTLPVYQQTRVSMDIRIIFLDDKEKHLYDHKGKGRMPTLFEAGEYYYKNSVD